MLPMPQGVQPSTNKPSLVICDEQLLVADGLAQALGCKYEIRAVLRSGRALEELLFACRPDLVITEVDLLEESALDVLGRTRSEGIKVPFIFCTAEKNPAVLQRLFFSGASGVIAKIEGIAELQAAIELALQGKAYLSSSFLPMVTGAPESSRVTLTPKLRTILQLIDEGLRSQQIADRLGLSRRTVESHKRKLKQVTNTHSPQELLVRARHLGLLGKVGRTVR